MLDPEIIKNVPIGDSRYTLKRVEDFCRNYLIYGNVGSYRDFCKMVFELIEQQDLLANKLDKDAYTFFYENEKRLWQSYKYSWNDLHKIPKTTGVYVIGHLQNVLYIGESKNMWDRLYKHHRIANHSSFRNRLKKLNLDTPEFFKYVYVCCVELPYGRKEFEEYLIHNYKPLCNKE